MPVIQSARTCKYLGAFSVPLIVAYSGLSAIAFNKSSPFPVASNGNWSGSIPSPGNWIGSKGFVAGNTEKNVPGLTTFEIGDVSASNGNWIGASWGDGNLFAPFTENVNNSQTNQKVFGLTQAVPLNSGDVTAALNSSSIIQFPATSSLFPLSNTNGAFWANPDGTSVLVTTFGGVTTYFRFSSDGGCIQLSNNSPLVWSAAQSIQSAVGFRGIYYISSTGNVSPNNWLIVTSFGAAATRYAMTWESPDGIFDMNTAAKAGQASFSTTPMGFLYLNTNAVVIGGISYTGWGMLMLPDMSGYFLIRILPQTVPAQGWRTHGAGVVGKMDALGNLYLQAPNDTGTLYFAGLLQPQIKVNVLIPIINVPHNPGILK